MRSELVSIWGVFLGIAPNTSQANAQDNGD